MGWGVATLKDFLAPILKAYERREAPLQHAEQEGTQCFRLFSGASEGIPGLVIERFGSVLTIQHFETLCPLSASDLTRLAEALTHRWKATAIVVKYFWKDRSREQTETSQLLFGQLDAEGLWVGENHLQFWIKPNDGYSTGLFLDQRLNRRWVAEHSSARRILNLFTYTSAFGVAALAGNASEVVNVDVSKNYLEWGRKNVAQNKLDKIPCKWIKEDCRDYVDKLVRRKEKFDGIILDPPTFGRSKTRGVFAVEKDLKGLWQQLRLVLNKGAWALISTNFTQWSQEQFERQLDWSGKTRRNELPFDFVKEPHPLKSVVLF